MSTWPPELRSFETFLRRSGLRPTRRSESPTFSDKILEYAGPTLAVRAVCDKGIWYVEFSDVTSRPPEWYDAALVQNLIVGSGADVLSLAEQIAFVRRYWGEILRALSSPASARAHQELALLRKARRNRRFPGLGDESS